MDRIVDYCLSDFSSVNAITDDWVASIIDNNFTDFESVSGILKLDFFNYDDSVQTARLESLREKLFKFEQQCDDNGIWKELAAKGIPPKKLTVIFWYAVEFALVKNSPLGVVKAGIAGATAYIALCSIRGASAYNIFNQFFYERCFELFRQLQRSIAFGSRQSAALKPKPPKGKGKTKRKAIEVHDDVDDDDVPLDKGEVTSMLEDITSSFFVFFNKVSLGGYPQVVQLTTNLVRDICAIDANRETNVSSVDNLRNFDALPLLSDRAFALFHRLCDEKHSTGGTIVLSRIVFPRLGFWSFEMNAVASSSTIPASFSQWKELMLRFLEKRIEFGVVAELKVILQVLENLYCRCTDRQDYRTKVSQTIVEVLQFLPRTYQYEFMQRVDCFSKSAKNSVRNFTIDIVPLILKSIDLSGQDPGPLHDSNDTVLGDKTVKREIDTSRLEIDGEEEDVEDEEDENRSKKKKQKKAAQKKKIATLPRVEPLPALYECLIRYCVDKSSSVRGRAVVHLTHILRDSVHRAGILEVADKMLENDIWMFIGKEKKQPIAHNVEGEGENEQDVAEQSLDETVDEIDNLVVHIVTLALEDDKAVVRKSGLQALVSLYPSIESIADFEKLVALLKKRCVDASVMVRKQAAESLNLILYEEGNFNEEIQVAWLEGVLPMINDREQSVQQAASKLIQESILTPLMGNTSDTTWKLLGRIEQEDNHRRLLVRTLFYQSNEGAINEKIVGILQQKLVSFPDHCDIIWMILAELAVVFKVSPKLSLQTWYQFEEGDSCNKVRYVAKVLTSASAQMTPHEKKELSEDLRRKISNYFIAAPHISTVYLCLAKLLDAVGEEASGKKELATFGIKVLNSCQKQVKKNLEQFDAQLDVTDGDSMESMELRLIRVITTIGEVIQFSPSLVEKCDELVKALKTIMASDIIQKDEILRDRIINSAIPSVNPSQFPSRPVSAQAQSPAGSQEVGGSQKTTGTCSSQGIGPIIPAHFIGGQLFTSVVRAYSVLALGKFCLMDYKRAKEFVPVFVRQLRVNTDHVVRNNIILVICDLCIRNTQLVDRYSPIIAGCLKDCSTLVRHQTLESLTNLIKEQFIRWEGQIMYRFVSTILDKDKKIREYAEFCLVGYISFPVIVLFKKSVLLQQFPDMFYRHFVECLLYFNEVSKKHLTADSEDVDIDKSLKFTLSGDHNTDHRMKLYKFMLATFDDKEKFTTMAHICNQAVQPIVTGEFNFKEKSVKALLRDSFQIMSSKEIKLKMDVGRGNEEDDDEPSPVIVAAAKKMITETFRKGIIQTVMPTLLQMREFLQEQRSPLLKDCLVVLRNICIEHKEQIEEVLNGDKQLQAEIEYDIKRFEVQMAIEEAQRKKAAEEADKERRRSRRSMVVGNILMSAIRSAKKSVIDAKRPVVPIKMEMDEDGSADDVVAEQSTPVEASPAAEKDADSAVSSEPQHAESKENSLESAVDADVARQQREVKLEDGSIMETALPIVNDREERESEPQVEHENIEPNRRRSSRRYLDKSTEVANTPTKNTFVVPVQKKERKRLRERSVTVDPNESCIIPARAISTPNKTMADVTFTDLELSAIRNDESCARPPRRSSRRRSARPTMEPISEDKDD